jgi:hypothetical protein
MSFNINIGVAITESLVGLQGSALVDEFERSMYVVSAQWRAEDSLERGE